MGCPFLGRGGLVEGTERDIREGVKNVHFLGDVLNGCSLMSIASYRDNMQATICLFFNHRNLPLIIYYIIIIALVSGTIVATR